MRFVRASIAALALGTAAAGPAPTVILHQDVPLVTVYAWERWGNFINAIAGSKTEIPYDAARLQVKVYTYPTGEIRAIRFANGVRTHRHINQTDTVLYSWTAHRVHFVDDNAVVVGPGDFALHEKGVYHSGEEIRRGGGIDLEFAFAKPGVHNDPSAYWSLAKDHPFLPAAAWIEDGRPVEAIGGPASAAPASAARYSVRLADLPAFQPREVRLKAGVTIRSRDMEHDRLLFVLSGKLTVTAGDRTYVLGPEDTARAASGADVTVTAIEDSSYAQASAPTVAGR